MLGWAGSMPTSMVILPGYRTRHGAMRIGKADSLIMDLRVDFLLFGKELEISGMMASPMKAVDTSWKEFFIPTP